MRRTSSHPCNYRTHKTLGDKLDLRRCPSGTRIEWPNVCQIRAAGKVFGPNIKPNDISSFAQDARRKTDQHLPSLADPSPNEHQKRERPPRDKMTTHVLTHQRCIRDASPIHLDSAHSLEWEMLDLVDLHS